MDCQELNNYNSEPSAHVLIEGGRATADPLNGVIRFNFYNSPKRQLVPATWFVKEEKSSKEFILVPIPLDEATLIEEFYQRALTCTTDDISAILLEEVMLADEKYKVTVSNVGNNNWQMKKKPRGWFGTTHDLQRGYGDYEIEGEEEEAALGPVRHLIFVVHGIGEALWSRHDVKVAGLIDSLNTTRLAIQRKQIAEWKKGCEKAKKAGYVHFM